MGNARRASAVYGIALVVKKGGRVRDGGAERRGLERSEIGSSSLHGHQNKRIVFGGREVCSLSFWSTRGGREEGAGVRLEI